MDKDRIAGAAKGIKGSLKELIGKAVGDAKLQSDGKAEQTAGKIQNGWRREGHRSGDRQEVNRTAPVRWWSEILQRLPPGTERSFAVLVKESA